MVSVSHRDLNHKAVSSSVDYLKFQEMMAYFQMESFESRRASALVWFFSLSRSRAGGCVRVREGECTCIVICVSPGWPFYLLRNTELDSHGGSEIRGKLWVAECWRAAAATHRKTRTASHTLRSAYGGGGKCFRVRTGSCGMLKLGQGPFHFFGMFAYTVFQVRDLWSAQ